MISLYVMNDQADAVLPELEAAREAVVEQLMSFGPNKHDPAEETRLTRALSVLGQLTGRIREHQRQVRERAPRGVAA